MLRYMYWKENAEPDLDPNCLTLMVFKKKHKNHADDLKKCKINRGANRTHKHNILMESIFNYHSDLSNI